MGLEPTTPCLKGRCSNQLSYGPVVTDGRRINSLHYPYFEQKVNRILLVVQRFNGVKLGCPTRRIQSGEHADGGSYQNNRQD